MGQPTGRDRLLALVSVGQLATGVAGMVVGLRRRRPYDVLWMHGTDDAIGRDVRFKGTALSAPVSMLVTQAAMTAAVARRPSRHASQALGGLGVTLVLAIWGSGWCGGGCGHRAGTLLSRRCYWSPSA